MRAVDRELAVLVYQDVLPKIREMFDNIQHLPQFLSLPLYLTAVEQHLKKSKAIISSVRPFITEYFPRFKKIDVTTIEMVSKTPGGVLGSFSGQQNHTFFEACLYSLMVMLHQAIFCIFDSEWKNSEFGQIASPVRVSEMIAQLSSELEVATK